jgi:hypothetical protein
MDFLFLLALLWPVALLIAEWLDNDKLHRPDHEAIAKHEAFAARRRAQAKWNWKTRRYDR